MGESSNSVWLIVLAAFIGAIATYAVSYVLERGKMAAQAALQRKQDLYRPIFDELTQNLEVQKDFAVWALASLRFPTFSRWDGLRETALAFMVPRPLRDLLDEFLRICKQYKSAAGELFDAVRARFPGRHQSQDDYGLVALLGDKMLVAPDKPDTIVVDYLRSQRPDLTDLGQFWTDQELAKARETLQSLPEWSALKAIHAQYTSSATDLHADLADRIAKITAKYQAPSRNL